MVHGVTRSQTRLSDFTFTFHFHALEKEMATHSSVLAWRIPGTAEPGGLPSMGSHSQTRLKRLSSSSSLVATTEWKYTLYKGSGAQTLVSKASPGRLAKTQMAGCYPQSFWFSRSGLGPENLHIWCLPGWCWHCGSVDHTLWTTAAQHYYFGSFGF